MEQHHNYIERLNPEQTGSARWRISNHQGNIMKTWTKPLASSVDAGFEVTRYLPSELDFAASRACKK
jgi:hypothetical protein